METIVHNGVIVEVKTINVIHDGTCSCWKDCDCAEDKGKIRYSFTGYKVISNPVDEWHNKPWSAVQSFIDKRKDKITVAMVNQPKLPKHKL